MESPMLFLLILAIITFKAAPAYSQMISASENALGVGSTVFLSSNATVTAGVWLFETETIVFIAGNNITITDSWKSRVTFDPITSSLIIRSLTVEDTGKYTLEAVNIFHSELRLYVQVPVSGVTLKENKTNLVEFNDTAVLMCSVSNGSSLSYSWTKGNSTVTAGGGVQFSNEGATLTITSVTRNDEGPFKCYVSNFISHEVSLQVLLNISYGPSNTKMMTMPTGYNHRTGSNITLSCSAESSPSATIQWMLNGVYLNHFGPNLQLMMVNESDSGNYKCIFHNTVTSRFNSASAMIKIVEPLGAVLVYNKGGPAILDGMLTLHCEVNGSVTLIQWCRDGQVLSADNSTMFDMGNKTLILKPVLRSDKGVYQCKAFNEVSMVNSSHYTVEVNYGPMEPVIMGPSMALKGGKTFLKCSADSHPPSHIKWYFNDSLLATTSKLMIEPLTSNMSGKYICIAFNSITGKNSTAYKMLEVVELVDVKVESPMHHAIESYVYNLTCNVNGDAEHVYWMKNGHPLHEDNRTTFSMDNRTLTFNPLHYNDTGKYQCVAFNRFMNMTSPPYKLNVNYGPKKPTIKGPNAAILGDNITLSCYASSNPSSSYMWFFNDTKVANTSEYVTPPLTSNIEGKYICIAFNSITGKNSTAYKMLEVVELVDVKVESPMHHAIESYVYNLTCNVNGDAEHVYWMKNGHPLHEDNSTTFSMDNRTLTFNPLHYNDTGKYQCVAFNRFMNMISPPYKLNVNYGPKKPTIKGPNAAILGDNITLSCYASSNPSSSYMWFFNDTKVANTSEYVTPPLTSNIEGKYICTAFNSITGKNSTAYKMLEVVELVDVKVESPMHHAIESHVYNLTCNVNGDAEHVYWMKNGHPLHEDNRMTFSMDNRTLTFNPLHYNDTGKYQCVAFNRFMNMTSPPYKLNVNFGPKTPVVQGPSYAETGQVVSFDCSAQSVPPSQYSWWYNGSEVANTSVFKTAPLTFDMSGEYTCKADNDVTGKNSKSSHRLTVIEAIESVKVTNNTVPIHSKNFTLICEVSGPYDSIYWMKGNMQLMNTSTAKAMSYHFKDNKLHFTPVTRNHDGLYKCVATNKAKSHLSNPYTLLVNYGPLTVTILDLNTEELTGTALMKCFADSRPDSEFHWFKNNLSSPLVAGSVLSFPVTNESDGLYICKARNPVTNVTMFQTKSFTAHAVGLHAQSTAALMMGLLALSVNVLFN